MCEFKLLAGFETCFGWVQKNASRIQILSYFEKGGRCYDLNLTGRAVQTLDVPSHQTAKSRIRHLAEAFSLLRVLLY